MTPHRRGADGDDRRGIDHLSPSCATSSAARTWTLAAALQTIEENDLRGRLRALAAARHEGAQGRGPRPGRAARENAERIIAVRADEVRSFSPAVLDPRNVEDLHDMRIAAKRLRYVLELTAPVFGKEAREGGEAGEEAPGPARRDPRLRRDDPARRAPHRRTAARGRRGLRDARQPARLRPRLRRPPATRRTGCATAASRRLSHTSAPAARCCTRVSSASGNAGRSPLLWTSKEESPMAEATEERTTEPETQETRTRTRSPSTRPSCTRTASCRGSTSTTACCSSPRTRACRCSSASSSSRSTARTSTSSSWCAWPDTHDQVDARIDSRGPDGLSPQETIERMAEMVTAAGRAPHPRVGGASSGRSSRSTASGS